MLNSLGVSEIKKTVIDIFETSLLVPDEIYNIQNLVIDAITDEVLIPWEGIKSLIKIKSEKNNNKV